MALTITFADTALTVAEAKTLRKEISKIAADYNYDWRGQLSDLEDSASIIRNTHEHRSPSTAAQDSPLQAEPNSTNSDPSEKTRNTQVKISMTDSDGKEKKVDVDKAIDEAEEEEQETRKKEGMRKRGKTPKLGDSGKGRDDQDGMIGGQKRGEEKGKKRVESQMGRGVEE